MTLVIQIRHTTAAASTSAVSLTRSSETNNCSPIPRGMPASVPADELFFWSAKWQADEVEAADDYQRGRVRHFENGREAANDLFTNDDDD